MIAKPASGPDPDGASSPVVEVDVAVLGGAFSGAAAGILLKRRHPGCRVLVIERAAAFDRKVGESTSEVAGCFLTRVLGLTDHLAREHITKHGLRMWFNDGTNEHPERCTEIGAKFQVRLPTYQLDRLVLDEHLLARAAEAGCELWRPATVRGLDLGGAGDNRLTVKTDGMTREVRARWVIDASGRASVIARKRGTWRPLDGHPTRSLWARFREVGDLDTWELSQRFRTCGDEVFCPRSAATNHLMGHGWWCWIIPLQDGDVSAGITWDPRIFELPAGPSLTARLHLHLLSHPIGRALFKDAVPVEKDTRTFGPLPYYSTEVAGDGWVCAGDACGFMDPLYSQGLDYCAHSVYAAAKLVGDALDGRDVAAATTAHNRSFRTSFFRWFHALYENKYGYLGDAELMHAAYYLDVGTYFFGPVRGVYTDEDAEFSCMPYHGRGGALFARFMAFYNRRLARVAEKRLAAGTYGRRNLGHRLLFCRGFSPQPGAALRLIGAGVRVWLRCELSVLFVRCPAGAKATVPQQPPEPRAAAPAGVAAPGPVANE